jgi:hypothetical protein
MDLNMWPVRFPMKGNNEQHARDAPNSQRDYSTSRVFIDEMSVRGTSSTSEMAIHYSRHGSPHDRKGASLCYAHSRH